MLPPGFVKRCQQYFPEHWEDMYNALLAPAVTSVRINPQKLPRYTLPCDKVPWAPQAYYLKTKPSFTTDPWLHAGAYYVQEASSMFLHFAIQQLPIGGKPIKVLDACAAPGGKSLLIADAIHRDSLIVSNEYEAKRVAPLIHNTMRWGASNIIVTNNSSEDFHFLPEYFDVIVIDAPCSGEGMFRKDSFAIEQWSEDGVMQCAQRQKNILQNIWPCLKPGGFLIYSTCTFNMDENEGALQTILQNGEGRSMALDVPQHFGIASSHHQQIYSYRFLPHLTQGEGFCLSVLQRIDTNTSHIKQRKSAKPYFHNHTFEFISAEYKLHTDTHQNIVAMHQNVVEDFCLLQVHLKILHYGICIGVNIQKKIKWHHHLALSCDVDTSFFHSVEISFEKAVKYLRGESNIIIDAPHGYVLLKYKNQSIGFVNNLGNRTNNLYPSAWRIYNAALVADAAHVLSNQMVQV